MIHINENQDEWNLLNYDDNISKTNDLNDKSIGGQLQILCCENYETAKNYDIRPEFLEEMKLWDQFFPNLTVEGKKIQINHISNTKTNHSLATRMMIARRLVMNFIFPDVRLFLKINLLHLILASTYSSNQSFIFKNITKVAEKNNSIKINNNLWKT